MIPVYHTRIQPGIDPDFAGINELFEDRRVILYLPGMWYVYILKCGNGNLYTGITDNLERRFKEHASGKGGHFTRSFGAKKMLYSEPCADKSSALKREARIKSWTRREKLVLIRAAPENSMAT